MQDYLLISQDPFFDISWKCMRNWNTYHLTNSIINSCTKLQVLSNILSQQQQVVPPYQPSPQYVSCQFWIYSHIVWNQSNFCFFTLTGYSESTFLAQHCTAKATDKARIQGRLLVQHLKIEIKNDFVYIQLSMGRKWQPPNKHKLLHMFTIGK